MEFAHLVGEEDPKNNMHEQLVRLKSTTRRNLFFKTRLVSSTLEHSPVIRIQDTVNFSPRECSNNDSHQSLITPQDETKIHLKIKFFLKKTQKEIIGDMVGKKEIKMHIKTHPFPIKEWFIKRKPRKNTTQNEKVYC